MTIAFDRQRKVSWSWSIVYGHPSAYIFRFFSLWMFSWKLALGPLAPLALCLYTMYSKVHKVKFDWAVQSPGLNPIQRLWVEFNRRDCQPDPIGQHHCSAPLSKSLQPRSKPLPSKRSRGCHSSRWPLFRNEMFRNPHMGVFTYFWQCSVVYKWGSKCILWEVTHEGST